jgi:hypothetical protein
VKEVFQGLKEFYRGYLPDFVAIHRAFFKVKKVRKYPLGVLEFFLLSESGEFLRNLVMTERENDIAQIKEDDCDRHLANPNPSQPPFSKGRRKIIPFIKGEGKDDTPLLKTDRWGIMGFSYQNIEQSP